MLAINVVIYCRDEAGKRSVCFPTVHVCRSCLGIAIQGPAIPSNAFRTLTTAVMNAISERISALPMETAA
jgi:hypothetical protein